MSDPESSMELKNETTERGFRLVTFHDRYDVACSLQESSIATGPAIWFGCVDANPQVCHKGVGWEPVPMPEDYVANTRMHLTQEQVTALLPYLLHFVKTGELPEETP